MKTKVQTITVELRWQFMDGATFVRSNVVGGYQAEIDGKSLRIYHTRGYLALNEPVNNRRDGMKTAAYRIANLIQGRQ